MPGLLCSNMKKKKTDFTQAKEWLYYYLIATPHYAGPASSSASLRNLAFS